MSAARSLRCDESGRLAPGGFLDDASLQRLLAMLNQEGETARVVGGAVRNALLGVEPGDIDVATTALPEVVMARAKAARLRTIPTGIDHGTVTIVVAGKPFEVTTLREDVETDGRHAVVRFGRDFATDAVRRDFTVNALSVGPDGTVHDYTGGLDDLRAGRLRFIGDARTRIREDYLRILRFFRFSATYAEGPLDPAGLAAAQVEADGVRRLSRERIRSEFLKLLGAPRALEAVGAMAEIGVLGIVLGHPGDIERFGRYRAIARAGGREPDPILGLAALALEDRAAPARLREALRLSNGERDRLDQSAASLALRPKTPPDAHDLSALLFAEGRRAAVDVVTLWHAGSPAPVDDPGWLAAARFAEIAAIPTLPLSGADVMARGVRSGPKVGAVLKTLQAMWIRAGFPDSPAVLHRLLDDAVEASQEAVPSPTPQ